MKIVVTGALGHIGSGLVRSLLGHEVIMIDNFSTNRYTSLFNLKGNYRFIQADITKCELTKIFNDSDVVIHLAAIVDAENSFDTEDEVNRVNFEGTKQVAIACKLTNVPMIFASTTSVYGVQENEVDETCQTLMPQSPYADFKIRAENYLKSLDGLRFTIIRMGTIFGKSPGMRFHTAVNKFCLQASIGQPITVWKTAMHQNRPYLDLVDAIRAIEFILYDKIYNNEIYNLVTVNTTVSNILDIIGNTIFDISINYVDSRIMNQLSYTVSSNKFKSLGFEFIGNIEDGINETLEILSFR